MPKMPVADIWIAFAAAALNDKDITAKDAGAKADKMLEEFHARFEGQEAGPGLRLVGGGEWSPRKKDA